jgi:hypothetical protein
VHANTDARTNALVVRLRSAEGRDDEVMPHRLNELADVLDGRA